MNKTILVVPIIVAAVCAACGGDSTAPVVGGALHLSADQAATVKSRIVQLAPVHPELAWLADSISLVIGTGVQVDSVGLTTDLGSGPFYAVGLQRAITTSVNASATFDVILFNNPSNPTDFVIVDGWAQSSTTTAPTAISRTLGTTTSNSVTAHLFHVAGTVVTAWRATAGSASFSRGVEGAPCASIVSKPTLSCSTTPLHASFAITATSSDNGASGTTRSATLSAVDVPGILFKFQF